MWFLSSGLVGIGVDGIGWELEADGGRGGTESSRRKSYGPWATIRSDA